ncbi:hypothetical protein [Microcella sp.]|uniref:hypothetical protein n=1 Tax=Microcella sp. TaxID=1913979 RepID=UPI0025624C2F|nr:hypothetical protein [Microcella sp.]MBX9471654.1 hypothetical protein [Microcella sp.]
MIDHVLQWLLVTVVLVLLNGVSQQVPWGIGSARQYRQSASGESARADEPKVVDVSSTPVVTAEFDERMAAQVSTLTTDRTFSWIISKPLSYYRPGRYLAIEVFTQALVAAAIVGLVAMVDDAIALIVIAVAALATTVAVYGQLTNWWGLTLRYAVGVSVTLIVSWVAAAALISLIW